MTSIFSFSDGVNMESQHESDVNQNSSINQEDGLYAEIKTSKGDILILLEYEKAPMTVANFIGLAEGNIDNISKGKGEPYYDGLIFHRVIAGFMIQGGCPSGTGMGDPGYKFPDEFNPDLTHSGPGIISMANSGPNTNGSQFFITHASVNQLDNKHSVFGKVVSGMEVVFSIADVEKGRNDKPLEDIVIQKVNIIRVGKEAKDFDVLQSFINGQQQFENYKSFASPIKEIRDQILAKEKENQDKLNELAKGSKKTDSGLMYIIQEEGSGQYPNVGDVVNVHYNGYLVDGTKFDSSYDRGTVFSFVLGQGRVIQGWDEGVALLKVGSKAKFIIPPDLGYGSRVVGNGLIPANSILIFEVELIEIQ